MKKRSLRNFLVTLVLVFGMACQAQALSIGTLSYQYAIPSGDAPGVSRFTVANLSASYPDPLLPLTQLVLLDSRLQLFNDTGLAMDIAFGDLGPGEYDRYFPDYAAFTRATFSAHVEETSITLYDGSVWQVISGDVTGELTGSPIADGDLALLDIAAERSGTAPVPEPSTLFLLAGGALALFGFKRVAKR